MSPVWFYLAATLTVILSIVLVVRENGRRRLDEERRRSARLSDEIITGAVDAILTIDADGIIRGFNAAAERMFGYRASEAIGQNVSMLMPQSGSSQHSSTIERYRTAGYAHIIGIGREVRCCRRDQSEFWADLSVSESRMDDEVCFTGIIRDLTERKTAEERLGREVRRLSLALSTGGLVTWEYDVADRQFTFTLPQGRPELGQLSPRKVHFNDALARVHQEDRRRVYDLLSETPRPTSITVLEFRIEDRDGDLHWVRNHVLATVDPGPKDPDWIGVSVDTTAARRAEDRATSLGRILEESRDEVYVFDRASLRFCLVNRAARDNLGYSNDELLALTPLDIKKDLPLEEFHRLCCPLDKGARNLVTFTARHYRKDGTTYPVDVNIMSGVLDQVPVYYSIILDTTDQEHYERKLRRSEEEHRLILEHAPCAIATLSLDGTVQSINRAGVRLLAVFEEQIVGRNYLDFAGDDDRDRLAEVFRQLADGALNYSVVPHHLRSVEDTLISVQSHSGVVHDSRGAPEMIVMMIHDLTERENRDKEIEAHRAKLAHVSRLGTLGQMAAGLAHEINQPLSAIATYAQACERMIGSDRGTPKDLEHALGQVSEQAHRAGDVIRRMRALARGDASSRQFCSAATLVSGLVPLVTTDARHAATEIHVEVADSLPSCYSDPVQIQQVLLNLVRNGIDAMRDSEPGRRDLTIRVSAADDDILFEVLDRGTGIEESERQHLFEPFFTTKQTGMGMGLSISKSIIAAHAGRIGYRPNDGGGSVFWFSLPTEADGENK